MITSKEYTEYLEQADRSLKELLVKLGASDNPEYEDGFQEARVMLQAELQTIPQPARSLIMTEDNILFAMGRISAIEYMTEGLPICSALAPCAEMSELMLRMLTIREVSHAVILTVGRELGVNHE